MSIGPVRNLLPAPEPQIPQRKGGRAPVAASAGSENGPTRESSAANSAPAVPSVPHDEVRVQWDNPMADYIMIYQFVNQQSGSLILQEPNEAMLNLIHQIREMLQSTQQQAAAASSAPVKPVE